jgi:hypothetical protein
MVKLLGWLMKNSGIHRGLFSGEPVDRDDQEDDEQHANHRPKPRPAAQPFMCVVD